MRHLLHTLLLLAGLSGALAGPLALRAQAKPPSGITVDIHAGYDNTVQLGRINPVIVDLKNASANKNLSGELALRYNDVEYVTPLELPTPSQKRLYLYFPCDDAPPYLTVSVRTKQYTEQFDLNDTNFRTAQPADTSVVVLTNQPGSLGAINQLETVRLHRDLYDTPTSAIGSSKTFVSYFRPDDIDPNPKFFDHADVIVLADIDYQQVKPELAEALKACVAGGTSIVFSLGLNGAGVSAGALAELCPLKTTGTVQLADLGEFGARYGISAAAAQATFATGPVAPGAEVLSRAGSLPAVVRSHWGSGSVTALAFDFTQLPFKQNPALGGVFQDTALAVPQNVEVRNWFVHPGPIVKRLGKLAEAHVMLPQFVLLFIAAYVVLIGPLNFLVLRQLKRQTLIWSTIPLLILGFTYGGLETGRITRGSDNVTSTFEELHVYPGASYVPYQSVMLVFTAERTHYNLEVEDASAFLFADVPQDLEGPRYGVPAVQQLRGLTGSKLDLTAKPQVTTTQGKWTLKNYMFQGYAKLPMSVDSQLTGLRQAHGVGALQGTFDLKLPCDLRDCYLYTGAGPQPVGDLPGQGHYDIGALPGKYGADKPSEDYLYAARAEIAEDQRRASSLGLDYRDEALLVGFTDQLQLQAEFKRPHKKHALAMVVVHLPYTQRYDPNAEPAVRTLITGGNGFRIQPAYGQSMYSPSGEQQLACDANDTLDLTLQMLGGAEHSNRFTLHLSATTDRNGQLQHAADNLLVYGWQDNSWHKLKLNADSLDVDAPLTGLVDSQRMVRLRLVSKVDKLRLGMPEAEAYGNAPHGG